MSPSPRSLFGRRSSCRTARRSVLALGVLAGLLLPTYFLGVAESSYLARDFHAYYAAAEAALEGRPFVGIDSGYPGAMYVYPPIAVLLFLPQAAAGGWQIAFAIQTAVNAAAAAGLAAVTLRTVERHGSLPAVDRRLLVGFVLLAAPSVAVLGLGQVDVLVALALAGGFLALERDRGWLAGTAFGAAALVKLFPAALGLWLLYRRSWRAVAGAVLTGVTGLAAGALLFGVDAYRRYRQVLAGRSRLDAFAGTVSPDFFAMSIHRPLSQLLPEVDPLLYVPLAAGLLVPPVVAAAARREHGFADRLRVFLAAVVATLLLSPASNSVYVVYVYFPLLCLLYLDVDGRSRLPLLVGTAAIGVPIQPAQVGAALSAVGVPSVIRAPVLDGVHVVLTVGSVPLLGLLAVLGWCALPAADRGERQSGASHPAGAD